MKTEIENSPFALLGVSVRDKRRKIIERAEEKSLFLDETICAEAKNRLINPRSRLEAEIAWLPGLAPSRAATLLETLRQSPSDIFETSSLNPLLRCNLMASALELIDESECKEEWSRYIEALAEAADEIDAESIFRNINEDRAAAGFSALENIDKIEEALAARQTAYCERARAVLRRLPKAQNTAIMTLLIDDATCGGVFHAPPLVDRLTDSYDSEISGDLEILSKKASSLIERGRAAAAEADLEPLLGDIERLAKEWHDLAKPILLNFESRGLEYESGKQAVAEIRSFAVDIANEQDRYADALRLTNFLRENFAEISFWQDRLEEYHETLTEMLEQQKKQQKAREEWEKSISFSADVGIIFTKKLSISPSGIDWDGMHYPLEAVTRVRWGGIQGRWGTKYFIGIGDKSSEMVIHLKNEAVYDGFQSALWNAVCIRLVTEMLQNLKEGKKLSFDGISIDDRGVYLPKYGFFGGIMEYVYTQWGNVYSWNAQGKFNIAKRDDKKCYCGFPFMNCSNASILAACINIAAKNASSRLSETLD